MTAQALPLWATVPELSQEQYHDLRMTSGGGLHQLCRRCGHCELAGGWCSTCRGLTYALLAHRHANMAPVARLAPSRPVCMAPCLRPTTPWPSTSTFPADLAGASHPIPPGGLPDDLS
jgi:hypothetical protein